MGPCLKQSSSLRGSAGPRFLWQQNLPVFNQLVTLKQHNHNFPALMQSVTHSRGPGCAWIHVCEDYWHSFSPHRLILPFLTLSLGTLEVQSEAELRRPQCGGVRVCLLRSGVDSSLFWHRSAFLAVCLFENVWLVFAPLMRSLKMNDVSHFSIQ